MAFLTGLVSFGLEAAPHALGRRPSPRSPRHARARALSLYPAPHPAHPLTRSPTHPPIHSPVHSPTSLHSTQLTRTHPTARPTLADFWFIHRAGMFVQFATDATSVGVAYTISTPNLEKLTAWSNFRPTGFSGADIYAYDDEALVWVRYIRHQFDVSFLTCPPPLPLPCAMLCSTLRANAYQVLNWCLRADPIRCFDQRGSSGL